MLLRPWMIIFAHSEYVLALSVYEYVRLLQKQCKNSYLHSEHEVGSDGRANGVDGDDAH